MRTRHEKLRRVVQAFDVLDGTSSLEADVGSERMGRAAKIERDLRNLQGMAGTAIVLAAIVLYRVFTD